MSTIDIHTVTGFRRARVRADLALAPGEVVLAGGTWLMSEPQPATTGFVDITTMGWPALEITDQGLRIAATCSIAELVAFGEGRADLLPPADWTAVALFAEAAHALLQSFKVWNSATVGGNICQAFAAASMVSLGAALDAEAVIWTPDGGEKRMPVARVVTGDATNALEHGEVLRAVEIPAEALRSRTRLARIALAEHGRSGAVVIGRVDRDGGSVFTVTAATLTPRVLRFAALPSAAELAAGIEAAPDFYTDPLGTADWRRGVSVTLALRMLGEWEADA